MRDVLAIPREEFVAPNTREKNGGLLARFATNQIRSNDCGIGGGFVHVPGQTRQQIRYVGFNHDLLVLASQLAREPRWNCGIVERGFTDTIFVRESDCVGANWLIS